jgi:hypothetical protein
VHRPYPIRAARLSVGGVVYEHVEILSNKQETELGIPNFFENEQLSFRCKDGLFTVPHWFIRLIEFNKNTKPPKGSTWAQRITIESDMAFHNVWIVDPCHYKAMKIPTIYSNDRQFTFVTHQGTFITSDWNVWQIEFGKKRIAREK